ncbi:hypothetical protein [Baekduia sp. Peel2402]|uniref:hypothetical protein n=1 Tax=Baekduia sp. Peel2402 TaxID=3458296 RepID=UPI00403E524E
MRDPRIRTGKASAAGALAVTALALTPAAGQAATPSFGCEASALRATLAGSLAIEPSVTGRGTACATGATGPSVAVTPLLSATALTASTTFDGTGPRAGATGAVAGLHVGVGGLLPDLQLPTEQFIAALPPISVPLPPALVTTLRLLVPTFPSAIELDIRDAVRAALPGGRLAAGDVLGADVLRSTAAAGCAAGVPSLTGSSEVVGLEALGQPVTLVDGVASQALTLLDTTSINLSTLDLSKVSVTTALDGLTAPLLATVQGLIGPALAALPPIQIPATVAQLTVRAPEQVVAGGTLTQRALHARLTLGGREILDAVAGEAKVGRTGDCPPVDDGPTVAQGGVVPTAAAGAKPLTALSASAQLLACTDRKLILLDVLPGKRSVKVRGAADRALVGRQVKIRLRATGRVVATAKVAKDGFFTTTAPLPSRAIRASNDARYTAELGRAASLPLKLHRRMTLTRLTATNGKVTVAGRVGLPLSNPVDPIRLVRRVSCHKTVLVKAFRPAADGTFSVTVPAPAGATAAVYRLSTRVRKTTNNPKRFPTFTLPAGIDLDRR